MKGQKIREAREAARLTQRETAKLLGVSTRALEEWEKGTRNPKRGEDYIVNAIKGLSCLTKEGREEVLNGNIDLDWAIRIGVWQEAKRLSKWGAFWKTFEDCSDLIPPSIRATATAEELAALVDGIKLSYDRGYEKGVNEG